MKVRRALYKDDDGCYIYSTLDMVLSHDYQKIRVVQKYDNNYNDYGSEDSIPEYDLFKRFSLIHIEHEYINIEIDSDIDKNIMEGKTFPLHLCNDESKAYIDVIGIKEQRKKEFDSISAASKIAGKEFN
ncbi:hypothetical protein AKUA2003_PHAGE200180 (plasmid) [Apilactobacillus kunkeei]|nr:hypothetical protein AKUA1001_PHAGE200180 [Apilactobacillus kunkeei]CAI2671303.1 hypothetical protein AKUA2003_PHAGE200180 [Apilactobacillus kunkeei]CAI2803566.1 hypothetical protein AKUA2002_PHAGE200180 [Apilactobacillus kunkeei]